MPELIIHQEVHVGGVDRPPPAGDVRAALRNRLLGWAAAGSSPADTGAAALGGGGAVGGAGKKTPNWMA